MLIGSVKSSQPKAVRENNGQNDDCSHRESHDSRSRQPPLPPEHPIHVPLRPTMSWAPISSLPQPTCTIHQNVNAHLIHRRAD